MKTIDKIIESQEAPKDKNVLWVNGDKLLAMVKGKWTPIGGGSSDNVQGGASGGNTPDMRYFLNDSNLQANGLYMQAIQQLSSVVVCDYQGMIMIYPGASVGALPSRDFRLCACGIDLNQRVVMYAPSMGMNQDSSVKEYMISQGLSLDTIESFANLTEEQFYNPATYA